MDCEKCGAAVDQSAEACPECGEPVVAAADTETAGTETASETASEFASDSAPAEEPASEPDSAVEPPVALEPKSNRKLILIAVAVILLAAIGGGAWFVTSRVASASSPEAAARKMLEAYALYDAKGILDVATHDTMAAADITQFEKQAADAKTTAKGAASLKNIVIGQSSVAATDKVSVDVTAEWLDPATGKYTKRTEKLIVVKKDGKWLVELF
jgi:uncharacterized protein HemX